jgi:hypothetical protein
VVANSLPPLSIDLQTIGFWSGIFFVARMALGILFEEGFLMPWSSADARRHTHKADTAAKAAAWAHVANATLRRTQDEGQAVREANAVVERIGKHRKVGK